MCCVCVCVVYVLCMCCVCVCVVYVLCMCFVCVVYVLCMCCVCVVYVYVLCMYVLLWSVSVSVGLLCKMRHTSSGVNLRLETDNGVAPSVSPLTSLTSSEEETGDPWRPLLLMVPLRLGLSTINEVYVSSLKVR